MESLQQLIQTVIDGDEQEGRWHIGVPDYDEPESKFSWSSPLGQYIKTYPIKGVIQYIKQKYIKD